MFSNNHKGEMMKNFKRMNQNKWLGGVLSGIAYKLNIPTWILRLAFFLALFSSKLFSPLCFGYLLVAIFAPKYKFDPDDYEQVCA
jgi:phage shock protein PspC (stress-responsive transcriptional regulator)